MTQKNIGLSDETHKRDSLLEELQRRATKDALSGLMNRETLELHIKERLKAMTPEETCALFIVDLDNFKQVNDTLGHRAGDQAIRQSARILSGLFRAGHIVGRLGGDEFVVFLCGQISEKLVRGKAAAICENLHLALGDRTVVNVTASVGVHLAGRGQEFDGLYQAADLALYKAKKAGKHRFCLKSRDGYQEARSEDVRPVNSITLSGLLEKMESGVALLEMGDVPRVIYVSPSFCRIIGSTPEAYPLPKPLTDLIHPDDLNPLLDTLREGLRRGEIVEHTHRVLGGGGQRWLWWQIRAAQVEHDGDNPVMLITTTDVSQYKEAQQQQEEQIRRLQTAFDQTTKQLWEVDVSTGVFRTFPQDGTRRMVEWELKHFPDELIDGGWIHPDSVVRFRTFAQELLSGRAQGFGNFAVRSKSTGYYSWATVSYRMLFDDVGRAVRAVGVLEDLPRNFTGTEGSFPDQRQLPEGLVADLIVRMRANLDMDTVEELWIEGSDLSGQVQDTRCSEILQLEKRNIFCEGSQKGFLDSFDRNRLLEVYREGRRWLCAEYRRADGSGNIRWVRHVLYLTEEPISRQVYLFVYLIWVDPDRQFEQAIRGDTQRDPVTRLYDRESVQRIAEQLFSQRKGGNRAVAILQVNGLDKLPADQGTNEMRYAITVGLSLVLGGSCLLGQNSPHQMVIVFPNVTGKEGLRRRLEEAVGVLRQMLSTRPEYNILRFVMGVELMPASTANYRAMLARAVRVCALWWSAASDTVAFAQEREDWGWLQPQAQDCEEQMLIRSPELERPLLEQEKDVALDCVSTMLSARTLDASLLGVLQTIGGYYRADRVYTLMLVEDRCAVIMTFEWTGACKRSIQQAVSGMRLERFPLLKRCMEERVPAFLIRHLPPGPESDGSEEKTWHFTAFPLINGQEMEGFLCIENAREHPTDAALFSTLIPFMLQQRERFRSEGHPTGATERLMGLPDLRAYMETLYTITSENYSSMGAVCLDIPSLSAINSRFGFEYGSRMLWYVAKTLSELFGSALLFRTWDAEFVIFCSNTTREVFVGYCGRLRSILQRRYPGQVRIGRAWSDGFFTGSRLAKEAKAAMQMEFAGSAAGPRAGNESVEPYATVEEVVQDGRFTVYFQPQIDMRTGALSGAEVVIRGVAEDGAIIPPSQFIEYLESSGMIRELDYFVLEQALDQADRWRKSGLGVIPVAVNLSRITLAHPSSLASVLAIQSRYPEFPTSALELEITERGDGIDTAGFQAIVERFHACGLRLGLDDFGSQYANLPLFTNVKFDTVKLDRSLIADVASNPINRTLVQDIVRICRTYGIDCVAEGVETQAQVDALLEMDCFHAQGFYYDRPLPAEVFEEKYLRGGASAESDVKEEKRI